MKCRGSRETSQFYDAKYCGRLPYKFCLKHLFIEEKERKCVGCSFKYKNTSFGYFYVRFVYGSMEKKRIKTISK
jgi:hypothetical protein